MNYCHEVCERLEIRGVLQNPQEPRSSGPAVGHFRVGLALCIVRYCPLVSMRTHRRICINWELVLSTDGLCVICV